MEVVIGLSNDNANWWSYDISFRKLHANGLERFRQINSDLYLTASQGRFQGSVGRFGDNNKDGNQGRGVHKKGSQATHSDFALTSTMGNSAQDVTTSTIVTSAIRSPIAQRLSQLPLEREVLVKRSDVLDGYLEGYDPVQFGLFDQWFLQGISDIIGRLRGGEFGSGQSPVAKELVTRLGKEASEGDGCG